MIITFSISLAKSRKEIEKERIRNANDLLEIKNSTKNTEKDILEVKGAIKEIRDQISIDHDRVIELETSTRNLDLRVSTLEKAKSLKTSSSNRQRG
jgi:hypothetical protein